MNGWMDGMKLTPRWCPVCDQCHLWDRGPGPGQRVPDALLHVLHYAWNTQDLSPRAALGLTPALCARLHASWRQRSSHRQGRCGNGHWLRESDSIHSPSRPGLNDFSSHSITLLLGHIPKAFVLYIPILPFLRLGAKTDLWNWLRSGLCSTVSASTLFSSSTAAWSSATGTR
jgi:hypothetical protein